MPDPVAFPSPTDRVEPAAAPRPVKAEIPPKAPAPRAQAQAQAEPTPAVERQPSTRLMIEEGSGGVFVYTVLDSETGRVLARIPRDEVARLSEKQGYAAGAVIDAQA